MLDEKLLSFAGIGKAAYVKRAKDYLVVIALVLPLSLFFLSFTNFLIFSSVVLSLFTSCFFLYPKQISDKKTKDIEFHLPLALTMMASEARLGVPLDCVVKDISEAGFSELSREFGKIHNRIKLGRPVAQAMSESAESVPSRIYSRVIYQILSSFREGFGNDASNIAISLQSISSEISEHNSLVFEEHISKMKMLMICLVVLSSVLPTGVAVLLMFLSAFGSGAQLGYLFIFVFPLVNLLMVRLMLSQEVVPVEG